MERDYSSLGHLLFDSLQKHGDQILQYIVETNETNTYADIYSRSIRTALHLKKKGITRKDIISTCTHNNTNTWLPFIASQFLGSICANFDPNLSHLDTIQLLKLVEPTILFVDDESVIYIEKCLQDANIKTELVVFGKTTKYCEFSEFLQHDAEEKNFIVENVDSVEDTALIAFTSGTTGLPKGIICNHFGLIKPGLPNVLQKKIVNFVYHSMYWKATIHRIIEAIYTGSIIVTSRKFEAETAWQLIDKYKITSFFMQPCYAIDFLNSKPDGINISSLTSISLGGWQLTRKLMTDMMTALPTVKIYHVYGQSEGPRLTTAFFEPNDYIVQILKPDSCGKILPNINWKIVDPITEERLGPLQSGELRTKSDYQMQGYYKVDSSEVFDSEGYLKTGDILYYDEEGCFYVVDRVKEMFKYKTWHISPAVLEEVIKSHPCVKEAAVIGIPAGDYGDHPMGIVTLIEDSNKISADEIENFVNEKVADYQKLRGGVRIVKHIPKTDTGKIQRSKLKKLISEI